MVPEPEELEVAVRGWATSPSHANKSSMWTTRLWEAPGPSEWMLVFDTETTTDHVQRLRFGGWQAHRAGLLQRHGLFYDPETVTDDELDALKQVAGDQGLELHPVGEWIEEVFFPLAVDLSATVVGHNLFFDLTRLAIGHDTTRSRDPRMRGGFSLKLTEDPTRPRILVKRASPSTTFIQFTVPDGRSPEQRQQEHGFDAPPYRGFFVDTASLANALLGGKWSLRKLAETLNTKHRKTSTDLDGPITEESIAYCYNDVTVTWECFEKLAARYTAYNLDVPLHRILSEASVGKAHLSQMRIRPWGQSHPDFPDWLIAVLMETYYGGRAECHIRRCPTLGVSVDFLSEYPTLYCLQDLWRFQIAQSINWEEVDPEEVNELLATVEVDDLLQPEIWRQLHCVVQIAPDGELLTTRAQYKPGSPIYNVALAHRYGVDGWWTLADAIVAKLESNDDQPPVVVRAIRFTPGPIQHGMRPINIAGQDDFKIDPYGEDFIQRLIELRAHAKIERDEAKGSGDPDAELWEAIQHGLKITANSVAYGIGIEFNTTTHRKPQKQVLHHTDGTSTEFMTKVTEREGSWFNPLIATLTAAGGRLLLAILIRLVRDAGGDYVYCDTDSLFITGLDPFQVQTIVSKFKRLNPYDPKLVSGSILKIESINYDPETEGLLTFSPQMGVVRAMVEGMHGTTHPHVLVIDEMNRANLPRVFGELMYLFEYRKEPIDLQYTSDFEMPANLFFIGTMNTADRSIRAIDIALRRRFEVFDCPPSPTALERWYAKAGNTNGIPSLISGFQALNSKLEEELDRHHTIGHTFFMNDDMTEKRLLRVWKRQLGPLIEEYFFDRPDFAAQYTPELFWPELAK